jgi:hypothetical protein
MLHRNRFANLLGIACLAAFTATAADLRISGPFTHENLSVYLLHSSVKKPAAPSLLTLHEAMEQKKAAVYETGKVEELAIENLSSRPVFVQAGDIVKGGQQDRVLTTDLLLPPRSGKVSIASLCVEQGRWTKRGAEPAEQFNASSRAVPTRGLKLAVREPGSQMKVWNEVAMAVASLASGPVAAMGAGANAIRSYAGVSGNSGTSMQLALEDRRVTQGVEKYTSALSKVVDGKTDAVGYVYAVNGKFSGADVYDSADLFRRMWPKLLQSSAAEALAEPTKTAAIAPMSIPAIQQVLAASDQGRAVAPKNNGSLAITKKESDKALLYETAERKAGGSQIHKSYIAK